MFKIPFLFEGITNIFKKPLVEDICIDDLKECENGIRKIEFDKTKCTYCELCLKVCAGKAIKKNIDKVGTDKRRTMEFDLASCTFCGLCKDFCPEKAIELNDGISIISEKKEKLKI